MRSPRGDVARRCYQVRRSHGTRSSPSGCAHPARLQTRVSMSPRVSGLASDSCVSWAAYRSETMAILRQRLAVAMGLFALFMGVGTFFEVAYYPERMRTAVLLYSFEAGFAALGVAL